MIILVWFGHSQCLMASDDTFVFTTEEQEQQYTCLLKELRCMTCPNQSIGDSQAPVAIAMKEDIYQRLTQDQSPQMIREYLLSRYGDTIVYRPVLKLETYALWFGPLLFLVIGVILWGYTQSR
jgi:cytochrome c-type biogenesis protein CcmH